MGKQRKLLKKKTMPAQTEAGRARVLGKMVQINFEADLALDQALNDCAEHEERKRRTILTRALKQYLEAAGFWPPSSRSED